MENMYKILNPYYELNTFITLIIMIPFPRDHYRHMTYTTWFWTRCRNWEIVVQTNHQNFWSLITFRKLERHDDRYFNFCLNIENPRPNNFIPSFISKSSTNLRYATPPTLNNQMPISSPIIIHTLHQNIYYSQSNHIISLSAFDIYLLVSLLSSLIHLSLWLSCCWESEITLNLTKYNKKRQRMDGWWWES